MGEQLHQVVGAIVGTMTTVRRPEEGTFSEN
jgi:hypothetical protein